MELLEAGAGLLWFGKLGVRGVLDWLWEGYSGILALLHCTTPSTLRLDGPRTMEYEVGSVSVVKLSGLGCHVPGSCIEIEP